MKTKNISGFISFLIILISVSWLKADNSVEKQMVKLPVEAVTDKIRGGLLGQILGNLNGLPHEMRYIDEPGNVKNYIPSLPEGAWTDDDTDFEWVYIFEMQKERNAFLSVESIYMLWKERVNKRIWASNRFARYLMDIGIKPPYTGYSSLNPWAGFNISGQFLCETFGLVAPGMPQTAARIGLNYTTIAINNEPAQTTQLFTTMISTAFIENDVNKILEAGLASLDKTSNISMIVNDVKKWHNQYPDNWKKTRHLLKEKYTQEGGSLRDKNGYELNTGSIIAALLYGKGDFAESLKLTFNFGWDADCNAATVGTILGVVHGYKKMLNQNDRYNSDWQIVDRYKNTTRDNMPNDETITSFADRIIELFEMVNENNGGSKIVENNTMIYQIPIEQPMPILKLTSIEQQKQLLEKELEEQIKSDLNNGTREEKAKAVYLAICLDINKSLSKTHSKQWKEGCYYLSGYWKIINNIFFYGDFLARKIYGEKFERAGFKLPLKQYNSDELYNDPVVWKDPKELY